MLPSTFTTLRLTDDYQKAPARNAWLEIGCIHADQARETAAQLRPDLPDYEKGAALTAELQAGLVAVTAFAVDGFYDTLHNELGPHPDQETWRTSSPPTPRHKQVSETLRYHLKLGPNFTGKRSLSSLSVVTIHSATDSGTVRRGSPLDYDHHAGHPDVGILRATSQGASEEGSLVHFFDPATVGGQQRGEVVHHVARDAGHASMGVRLLDQLTLRPFSRRGR